jgi:hypothetical protein
MKSISAGIITRCEAYIPRIVHIGAKQRESFPEAGPKVREAAIFACIAALGFDRCILTAGF